MSRFRDIRRAQIALCAVGVSYLVAVTSHVMVRVGLECYPYYDLGIYAEAAYHLSWAHPNPWLSARYIHLFNDHFDPVVFLMAPFVHALPLPYGAVVFEACVMLLSLLPLLWLVRNERLSASGATLLALLLLFHLGSVTAVHYPIHPTTWALLPWVALCAAIELRKSIYVFAAFVALMACKEEFPFVAVILAPLLWRRGLKGAALGVASTAVCWLGFTYLLRPYWLGPIEGYASVPFAGLQSNPLGYVKERITQKGLYETLPLFVAPYVPVGAWLCWTRSFRIAKDVLALGAPPFALRVLAQQWAHQYHAVTAAGLALPLAAALRERRVPRLVMLATVVVLVATNHERVRDAASLIAPKFVSGKKTWCEYDPGRIASLQAGRKLMRERRGKRMLISMNVLPKLVDLPHTFVPPGPPPERKNPYDVVFFEKPPHGMDWPVEFDEISRAIERWRTDPRTHLLLDDAHVFAAEGQFLWDDTLPSGHPT